MKITIYELLGKVKDENQTDIYVKYFNRLTEKEEIMWACKENIIYKLDQIIIKLNDEVEIIEEDKEIEKLELGCPEDNPSNVYIINEYGTKCYLNKHDRVMAFKINELIDEVNKLKNN